MFRQKNVALQVLDVISELSTAQTRDKHVQMEKIFDEFFPAVYPDLMDMNFGTLAYFHSRFTVSKLRQLAMREVEMQKPITQKEWQAVIDFYEESIQDSCLEADVWNTNGKVLIQKLKNIVAKFYITSANNNSIPAIVDNYEHDHSLVSWRMVNLHDLYFKLPSFTRLMDKLLLLEHEDWLGYLNQFRDKEMLVLLTEMKNSSKQEPVFVRVADENAAMTMKRFCCRVFLEAEFKKRESHNNLIETGSDFKTMFGYVGSLIGRAVLGKDKRNALTAFQRGIVSKKDLLQMKAFIDDDLLEQDKRNLLDGTSKYCSDMIDIAMAVIKQEFPKFFRHDNSGITCPKGR